MDFCFNADTTFLLWLLIAVTVWALCGTALAVAFVRTGGKG